MRILSYNKIKLDFFQSIKNSSTSSVRKLVRKTITQKNLPRLKKENFLHLNFKIDCYFQNKKSVIKVNSPFLVKDLFCKSFLIYSLRKNMILNSLGYKKQYFYQMIDIILSFSMLEKEMVSFEIFSTFKTYNDELLNKTNELKRITLNSIYNLNQESQQNIYSNLAWSKLHQSFNYINFNLSFLYLSLFLNKNVNLKINSFFLPEVFTLEKHLNLHYVFFSTHNKLTLRNLIRRKHLLNFLMGHQTNATLNNSNLNYLIANRILQASKSNLITIYKQGSFGLQNLLRFGIKNQIYKKKFRALSNQYKYKQETSSSLLYLTTRLDEKKEVFVANPEKQEQILGLRNFFIQKGKQKFNNNSGYSISTLSYLNTIYYDEEEKEVIFSQAIQDEFLNENQDQVHTNVINFENHKSLGLENIKITNEEDVDFEKEELKLNKKILWKQKKLTDLKSTVTVKNIDKYFSVFLGENVSVIFINALALTKFAYVFPMKKKSAQRFLNHIEREMIQRYKYVAIYIQDFIRVCYISFFLKKPTFLANFMGYQIAQLPRNRKETQIIRFLIKVIKIFGAQRREIVAVKVEFKGRVNRWRRTKVIRGTRGTISFFKFNTRIEYGSGKAITRKGTLGIRLWLCYKWTFTPILRTTLLGYMEYSQQFKAKTIDKFLYRFQSKIKPTSSNKILW